MSATLRAILWVSEEEEQVVLGMVLGCHGRGASMSIPNWRLLGQGCIGPVAAFPTWLLGPSARERFAVSWPPTLGCADTQGCCSFVVFRPCVPDRRSGMSAVAVGVIIATSCCLSGFIAFSSMPRLAEKIKLFFALAPLYTFCRAKGPVLKIAFLPVVLKVCEVFMCCYD